MTTPLLLLTVALGVVLLIVWNRLQKNRRDEFIRTFSLPPGLYEKLLAKHPHLSLKDCQLVGQALRQFFLAYLKSGRQYVSMPSQVVDDLWHEFILYTRNYEMFCRRAFGGFLHHTPAAALEGMINRQKDDGLRRCWWQACREENIHPQRPTRLPLLFALDRKLGIKDGFVYAVDCRNGEQVAKLAMADGTVIHCAGDLKPLRKKSGSDSGCGGGSSCGGHGSHSDGGSADGCGGGGCGGGGD